MDVAKEEDNKNGTKTDSNANNNEENSFDADGIDEDSDMAEGIERLQPGKGYNNINSTPIKSPIVAEKRPQYL